MASRILNLNTFQSQNFPLTSEYWYYKYKGVHRLFKVYKWMLGIVLVSEINYKTECNI